ncbi:glycosyltransferase family 2 protein, partial [Candidatus Daviesbacteria bacterium]|nr:glycosyltransferase family 2 protein [Candidatus Daviesbacteria bacterium]
MKTLSIVIPVYNEEQFIVKTLQAVCISNSLNLKKEIIIVDDGSTDNTPASIKKGINALKSQYENISFKTLFKKLNEGKGAAVRDGFRISTGDIVILQDADLEYSPEDYPILLEPFLKNDVDVVYGSRFISNRPHRVLYFWHFVVNSFLTAFSNMLTNLNLTDMETGYKVFKGELIRKLAEKIESKRFGFEPEITARISKIKGLKIFEVGISYFGRTYNEG